MVKRLFDVVFSLTALIVLSPVLLASAIGIRLSSKGPILFRAKRVGVKGEIFTMHKLRTMHTEQPRGSGVITAKRDPRIFPFGALLRTLKIDELPQLYDVLRGKMSIVGPRPEDPKIVEKFYAGEHYETLDVKPGLTSPGSIYNYTHGEEMLERDHPERVYAERLLPLKLALELVYVRERSFLYDIKVIFRTIWVILCIALGRRNFPEPPEMRKVHRVVPARSPEERQKE